MRGARLLAAALVVAALSALSSGCARSHLFYDTRELRHEPLEEKHRAALVEALSGKLSGRRLTWVDADGREQPLSTDKAGLSRLPLAELGALWLATAGHRHHHGIPRR